MLGLHFVFPVICGGRRPLNGNPTCQRGSCSTRHIAHPHGQPSGSSSLTLRDTMILSGRRPLNGNPTCQRGSSINAFEAYLELGSSSSKRLLLLNTAYPLASTRSLRLIANRLWKCTDVARQRTGRAVPLTTRYAIPQCPPANSRVMAKMGRRESL